MTLLDGIQQAAIDSKIPIADLLRQCMVLAARLKNQELADWARRELNGYEDGTPLPTYRILETPRSLGHLAGPFGSDARNVPIPVGSLPDEIRAMVLTVPMATAITTIESLALGEEKYLKAPWLPDVIALVAQQYPLFQSGTLVEAWRPLPTAALVGIVDTVRTRILEFTLKLQGENPDAGESPIDAPVPPISPQTVHQHFHTTIVGGQANVGNLGPATIGDKNVATGAAPSAPLREEIAALVASLRKEADALPNDDSKQEAQSAVRNIERYSSPDRWDPDRIKKYLSLYSSIATIVSPTIPHLEQMLHTILTASGGQ